MEPGSKAEISTKFPSYCCKLAPKAIDKLKERFGGEGLLVQIYVRDLLTLWRAAFLRVSVGRLGKKQKSSNRIRGIPFFRTVDELSSARGERRGDGSFGTDQRHPPPESTKKDYHATQVNKVETTTNSFIKYGQPSEGRIVYRHCRVVFRVSSSPFLLNASIMHLLENCQPQHEEVAQKLKCSFYVDNCVSCVFNTDEQGRFIEHAKLIMLNGCFNLRGFESNVAGKNVDRSSGDTSVLGVIWNLETDTLKCCTDMDTFTCETKVTKRLILAIVPKLLYPIGL
ncbi:integrase catalytic domain-containing protein [Trichonephila clavipes]|nr:integrase catalytic domain-containing protein [Trichonephila clavipes]